MKQLSTLLLCALVFLLSGCPRHAVLSEVVAPPLALTHTEVLPEEAGFLEFSKNGTTFIVAGKYEFLYFYDTATFEKHVTIKRDAYKSRVLAIQGTGYIDDNTWYFATEESNDYGKREALVNIWQIEPLREIHQYDWGSISSIRPVLANKNHIAHNGKMLNWHDGNTYDLFKGYIGAALDYKLTPDSQVVTRRRHDSGIHQFYDPIKQESMFWDIGSGRLTLSPDARYALITSNKGRCELWRVSEKEELGRCGRNSLFGGEKRHRIAFQRDSQVFAIAAGNEKISVYETQPFKQVMSVTMPNAVQALALNEGRLAAVDNSGTVRVWDVAANKLLGEYASDSESLITFLIALQPGGGKLVVTQFDRDLQQSQLMVFDLNAARSGGI